MPKSDTKSAALSRLFGNKPGTDGAGERREETSQEQRRNAAPEASGNNTPATQNRASHVGSEAAALEETGAAPVQDPSTPQARKEPREVTRKDSPQEKRKKERLTPLPRGQGQKNTSQEPPASPETTEADQEGEGSGYLGSGRYRRTTGVLERITPYVRPDQAEALRIAVALRNDPRGSDISAIIQSLLDEAGYQGEES